MRTFEQELVGLSSDLKALAMTLTRSRDTAEDLVQDTFFLALRGKSQFQLGTNMKAWAYMIMRNCFYSNMRKQKLRLMDSLDDPEHFVQVATKGGQHEALELKETLEHLEKLPEQMRQAVTLIGMSGFSYEEAAQLSHSCTGTVKSRASRGRALLARQMSGTQSAPKAVVPFDPSRFSVPVPAPSAVTPVSLASLLTSKKLVLERRSRNARVRIYRLV